MKKQFNTPRKWAKYEKEAVRVCIEWLNSDQEDWYKHIHIFAAKVYNRGDGLVFLYFNERTQRSGMTKEFKDWMARILDHISQLPIFSE